MRGVDDFFQGELEFDDVELGEAAAVGGDGVGQVVGIDLDGGFGSIQLAQDGGLEGKGIGLQTGLGGSQGERNEIGRAGQGLGQLKAGEKNAAECVLSVPFQIGREILFHQPAHGLLGLVQFVLFEKHIAKQEPAARGQHIRGPAARGALKGAVRVLQQFNDPGKIVEFVAGQGFIVAGFEQERGVGEVERQGGERLGSREEIAAFHVGFTDSISKLIRQQAGLGVIGIQERDGVGQAAQLHGGARLKQDRLGQGGGLGMGRDEMGELPFRQVVGAVLEQRAGCVERVAFGGILRGKPAGRGDQEQQDPKCRQ